ncbi:MAG: bifunctional 2',3'-cyclic-nucleotide 2'-phosphodiesterase/3'-nucleotidase [Pseudomonadota bacterium]
MARPPAAVPTLKRAQLRVLGLSDLHMNIDGYDYFRDEIGQGGGLAALVPLIETARAEVANCVLFDNGDTIQGSPFADVAVAAPKLWPGGVHPMVAALNALGLDGATLGNHEFNYGIAYLHTALEGRAYPLVCANIRTLEGDNLYPPHVILTRALVDDQGTSQSIKIGLFGVCPPQILKWDQPLLEGKIEAEDMVEAACRAVTQLRAAGAEIVVGLSHSGIVDHPHTALMENATHIIAQRAMPDALIAGHTHKRFPDTAPGLIHGVPTVQPGFWGSHLGVIDLDLTHGPAGWEVVSAQAHLRAAPRGPAHSPRFAHLTADLHAKTQAQIRQPVAHIQAPLTSYFSQIAPTLSVDLVLQAKSFWGREILAQTLDRPVLAAASPFKAGGRAGADHYVDIEPGALLQKHVGDLYFYPNTLVILPVTGAVVKEWLERSASQFNRIEPGARDLPLLAEDHAAYDFDVISGVSYRFDLSKPAAFDGFGARQDGPGRVVDLQFDGAALDPKAQFYLVTSGYRVGGGGGFPVAQAGAPLGVEATPARTALARYLAQTKPLPTVPRPVWSFVPQDGASAWFDTGPGARKGGHALPSNVRYQGPVADGFDRYILHFDG